MEKKQLSEIVISFSRSVVKICQQLDYIDKQIISKQLFRSATAIGAISAEAKDAESADDFIHKMKIAAKETDETEYWLSICKASKGYRDCDHLLNQCISISKILSKIIASSKKV